MTHDRTGGRRRFLGGVLALPVAALAPGPRGARLGTFAPALAATPRCVDADDLTPRETEGPYFKRNSPERSSLLDPGLTGTRLVVSGQVLSTSCQPLARALIDVWQADDRGEYDLDGYRLRGHQFTDGSGRYVLETIVPGQYARRTRHIHVRVQAPNGPVLTTQLYFPGEASNRSDGLYRPDLEVRPDDAGRGGQARFDFVVRT